MDLHVVHLQEDSRSSWWTLGREAGVVDLHVDNWEGGWVVDLDAGHLGGRLHLGGGLG